MATEYSPPKRWAHGDLPTAADMNLYSRAIASMYERHGPASYNIAVRKISGGEFYCFVHRYRYLHYLNAGTLADLTGTYSTTLDETPSGVKVFDLSTVNWLTFGSVYTITDSSFACEIGENTD